MQNLISIILLQSKENNRQRILEGFPDLLKLWKIFKNYLINVRSQKPFYPSLRATQAAAHKAYGVRNFQIFGEKKISI